MVPPITMAALSVPGPHFITPGATPTGADATVPWYRAMTRSAYDAATLARAVRQGVDPDGDPLMAPMPRYDLDEEAVAALLAYLGQLSVRPPPGLESGRLHLATVIAPDAPPGAAEAVLGVLRAWAAQQRGEMSWELHFWRLSGSPAEWESQLESEYRQQPVFAVLSGVGGAEWSPVHRFCERMEIPCVLPSVDVLPQQAIQEGDFYSLYFSPALNLEADLLGRYLQGLASGAVEPPRVVQVYADPSGKRASESLRSAAGSQLANDASDRRFRRIAPAAALDDLSEKDLLVLWLRPPELMALAALTPEGPPAGRVFLSAWLAPQDQVSLPATWRSRATYVSLFDDWNSESAYSRTWLRGWLARAGLPTAGNLRLQADAYGAAYFFTRAFAHMQKQRFLWGNMNLTRPFLIESLERVVAKNTGDPIDIGAWTPFYGRLSLGSGQRIAAKGGYLLRYASPESDQLLRAESPEARP